MHRRGVCTETSRTRRVSASVVLAVLLTAGAAPGSAPPVSAKTKTLSASPRRAAIVWQPGRPAGDRREWLATGCRVSYDPRPWRFVVAPGEPPTQRRGRRWRRDPHGSGPVWRAHRGRARRLAGRAGSRRRWHAAGALPERAAERGHGAQHDRCEGRLGPVGQWLVRAGHEGLHHQERPGRHSRRRTDLDTSKPTIAASDCMTGTVRGTHLVGCYERERP